MAGNAKFEMSSVSPEDSGFSGSYQNGQRGSYPGASLDRSGSFREGSEGRSFSSGTGTSKSSGAELSPLPQYLLLDPISMGDQKSRAGELRRALGFSFSNVSEDNSFGAAHSKAPSALSTDDLKRYKQNILEGSSKARNRVKTLDDSLVKLNKYCDGLGFKSKKQPTNERTGGSNLLKMGNQSHRSSPDLVTQKLEERNKNIGLNKRSRTPISDTRPEGRSNGVPRQHTPMGKDKDVAKEGSSDVVEEKLRRLPAGGEGWDKKMKRKRSVSSVFHRPLEGDGDVKRAMHGRLGSDTGIQTSDVHGFRPGSSSGANGTNKVDGNPSPASMSARVTPKNELEKPSLSRDLTGLNKERLPQKNNTKLPMREETHVFSPSSVTKGKASRAHRTGPTTSGNSSPSFSRMSGTAPEDWEQPLNVNKVHSLAGVNNRKRPLPTESAASPPMAQWVGQRPQKISRNRRTNIISPTSNHDETLTSEGCGSDLSARASAGMNVSHPGRNMGSSSQQLKVKLENAPSPARLSESEDNSTAENKSKDKIIGASEGDERVLNSQQHASPSGLFTKKTKAMMKEQVGDGVRRQGRTARGSSFSRGGMSSLREKSENPGAGKPVRNSRPGSEKSGSKSGRPPLKKNTDRKGVARLGTVPNSSSPDLAGESDDDREELVAAAQYACNASYNGCSSSFWKRMEPIFYVKVEDRSFLEEQLKSVEGHQSNLSEMHSLGDNLLNRVLPNEDFQPQSSAGDNKRCILDNGSTEHESAYRGLDADKELNSLKPLYQRVLSALIVEDEFDEFEESSFESNALSLSEREEQLAVASKISCNGSATHIRFPSAQVPEDFDDGDYSFTQPDDQAGPRPFQNDVNGPSAVPTRASGASLLDCQYDQMCVDEKLMLELQYVGLYPESVPDLAEGEDEMISQDILQLKKQLSQQVGNRKAYLDKIKKALEEKESEGRELEKLAMNRLTELAYRKLLATRGSSAARIGISKVSRHVALAFIRRTLARWKKFDDTASSCFSEPALRDVLLAVPNYTAAGGQMEQNMQAEARSSGSYIAGSEQLDHRTDKSGRGPFDAYESLSNQSDHAFAKSGPISNRGKKKEVLLDDVGGNSAFRSTSALGSNLMGGAKGKRSERESKTGRPSISNLKGERKTKAKPKQKAANMSTHPVQPSISVSNEVAANRRREGLISPGNILDSSKEGNDSMDLGSLPLEGLDPIEGLSVANEFEEHQDLTSWLSFDDVNIQDQDHDIMGLEIPMDDLSELNMF